MEYLGWSFGGCQLAWVSAQGLQIVQSVKEKNIFFQSTVIFWILGKYRRFEDVLFPDILKHFYAGTAVAAILLIVHGLQAIMFQNLKIFGANSFKCVEFQIFDLQNLL